MVEINLNISGVKISKNRLNAQHIRQRFTDGVFVCVCVCICSFILNERLWRDIMSKSIFILPRTFKNIWQVIC